ncbi:DUF2800 domain-containing protein [bacterium]|nr:DUF2800 domain-containing protein [bacterium]
MPSEHSTTVGGSSAGRVIGCPGSVVLCQEAPPQTSSIYAQVGTALHDCMEQLIDPDVIPYANNLNENWAWRFEGQIVKGIEITPKLIEHKLIPAITWFRDVLKPDEWMLEAKCAFPGIPGAFGTVDVIYRKKGEVGVADWKFGDGKPVHLKDNPQIQFYLFAAISEHSDWFEGFNAYRGHIFQPFYNPNLEKWQDVTLTHGQLLQFEKDLNDAWELSKRNDPILNIGDHCDWCPARGSCPELRSAAKGLQEREGDRTAEEYATDLAKATAIEGLVKEMRKNATDFVRRGGVIEGWKLVDSLKDRAWIDPNHIEGKLRIAGLRVKDIYPKTLPTPAGAERAFKSRGIEFDVNTLTHREVSGDKLVPDTAKGEPKVNRAAILKKVAAMGKARRLMK